MKLSTAISTGLTGRSECALQMFELTRSDRTKAITACCTLGAAYLGAFGVDSAVRLIEHYQAWDLESQAFTKASMAQLEARYPILRDRDAGEALANAFDMTAHDLAGPGADLGAVIVALNDELSEKSPSITEALARMGC